MRIIDNLLKSEETNKTTHWFLSQTAKQNKWGKMYPHPKVRQLTAEEITQAETHSLKSLNKLLPGRPIIAQSGSYVLYWKDHWCVPSLHRQKTEHIYGTTRTSYARSNHIRFRQMSLGTSRMQIRSKYGWLGVVRAICFRKPLAGDVNCSCFYATPPTPDPILKGHKSCLSVCVCVFFHHISTCCRVGTRNLSTM